jgi:uncharacterized membrane protein YeaQ/YmgE (transglycosylase-associated protein family)
MGRRLLAVIVALIVANAVYLIGLMIATMFAAFSPKNFEYMSMQERATYFSSMPLGAYLTEIFAYIIGSLAAGWIVSSISRDRPSITLPLIVGVILTLGALVTLFISIPGQPAWVIVLSLILFIPFTLLGQRFARR